MKTKHDFQLVTGPSLQLKCMECGGQGNSDGTSGKTICAPWYADLKGEPFKAYYCQSCKRALEKEDSDND